MKDKTVNYVVATWGGRRRLGRNFGDYLLKHMFHLEKVSCNLSQITVVWPHNRDLLSYKQFMRNLDESLLNGTPVKILKVQNEYQSYSQYIRAFQTFGDFDYFIFTEDDYVPVLDDFDQVLVKMFDRKSKEKRCGYLNGYTCPCSATHSPWAGISWGISSREVLNDVDFRVESLNPEVDGPMVCHYAKPQFFFSCIFLNSNYSLCDVCEEYDSWFFRNNLQDSDSCGLKGGKEIISPLQLKNCDVGLYSQSFLESHRWGLRLM